MSPDSHGLQPPPTISAAKEHRRVTSLQEQAPAVSNFCLQHFKEIDKDGNGSISAEEIKAALSNMNLNPKERALLAQVQANFDEVGHIIDSKVEKEVRVMQHLPHPNGFVPPPAIFEVLVTVHSYQINLEDLKSYVVRLEEKYGGDNWWTAQRKRKP